MDDIKIAYVVPSLKPCGPTAQLYNLIRHIDKTLFQVNLISLSSETPNNESSRFKKHVSRLHTIGLSRLPGLFFAKSELARIISSINPDIIHTQGLRADNFCSKMKQFPIRISTQRNSPFIDYPMLYGSIPGYFLARLHYSYFRNIPQVISCSNAIAQSNYRFGIKTTVIQNGVSLCDDQILPSTEEKIAARIRLGLPINGSIFISAGPLIRRKSPEILIKTFRQLANVSNTQLYFLGDGPLLKRCQYLANGAQNIFFRGWVKDISAFLVASDALISASVSEGLPNAVLEALSWGLPVFLSDIPSHREILGNHDLAGNLFTLNNSDELLSLLKSFRPSVAASEAARNVVTKNFNAARMSSEYQQLYLTSLGILSDI